MPTNMFKMALFVGKKETNTLIKKEKKKMALFVRIIFTKQKGVYF